MTDIDEEWLYISTIAAGLVDVHPDCVAEAKRALSELAALRRWKR